MRFQAPQPPPRIQHIDQALTFFAWVLRDFGGWAEIRIWPDRTALMYPTTAAMELAALQARYDASQSTAVDLRRDLDRLRHAARAVCVASLDAGDNISHVPTEAITALRTVLETLSD